MKYEKHDVKHQKWLLLECKLKMGARMVKITGTTKWAIYPGEDKNSGWGIHGYPPPNY